MGKKFFTWVIGGIIVLLFLFIALRKIEKQTRPASARPVKTTGTPTEEETEAGMKVSPLQVTTGQAFVPGEVAPSSGPAFSQPRTYSVWEKLSNRAYCSRTATPDYMFQFYKGISKFPPDTDLRSQMQDYIQCRAIVEEDVTSCDTWSRMKADDQTQHFSYECRMNYFLLRFMHGIFADKATGMLNCKDYFRYLETLKMNPVRLDSLDKVCDRILKVFPVNPTPCDNMANEDVWKPGIQCNNKWMPYVTGDLDACDGLGEQGSFATGIANKKGCIQQTKWFRAFKYKKADPNSITNAVLNPKMDFCKKYEDAMNKIFCDNMSSYYKSYTKKI